MLCKNVGVVINCSRQRKKKQILTSFLLSKFIFRSPSNTSQKSNEVMVTVIALKTNRHQAKVDGRLFR